MFNLTDVSDSDRPTFNSGFDSNTSRIISILDSNKDSTSTDTSITVATEPLETCEPLTAIDVEISELTEPLDILEPLTFTFEDTVTKALPDGTLNVGALPDTATVTPTGVLDTPDLTVEPDTAIALLTVT